MKLEIRDLSKSYGDLKALDNISFELEDGIYGLLGPNGAGKSTLMNILMTNLNADAGSIFLDGMDITRNSEHYYEQIGYMPQNETLYPFFTGLQFLYYMAAVKDVDKNTARQESRRLLRKLGLYEVRHRKIRTYSGGMKRRLMLAAAMINKPKLLILDEPTAGMDPRQRVAVRNLIGEMALSSIVILSTHVVSDVEFIARKIILMEHGHILYQEKPHVLREILKGKVYTVRVKEEDVNKLLQYGSISAISREENGAEVRLISDQKLPFASGIAEPTLEDVYQYLFKEEGL